MSTHIGAKNGDIAESILLPGDPLRAKFIAENVLENAVCFNEVRGMLGFTGTYKGKRLSVMGTGMGMPSLSIYVNELFMYYGVKNAIRIGTCGAVDENVQLGSLVLGQSSCTDSGIINQRFGSLHYTPICDFELLNVAYGIAKENNFPVQVGAVVSSDLFYDTNENWKLWKQYGVKGIEMESAELYMLGAKHNRKVLGIFSVSDNIVTGQELSARDRQEGLKNMVTLGLETLIKF